MTMIINAKLSTTNGPHLRINDGEEEVVIGSEMFKKQTLLLSRLSQILHLAEDCLIKIFQILGWKYNDFIAPREHYHFITRVDVHGCTDILRNHDLSACPDRCSSVEKCFVFDHRMKYEKSYQSY